MSTNENSRDNSEKSKAQEDANRDPLSGRAGAHPVGTGVGAAAGGVAAGAATGAAIGTVAGPVGTAVGAAVGVIAGAVGGGLAGKGVAESINPTQEHGYWKQNYSSRPYAQAGIPTMNMHQPISTGGNLRPAIPANPSIKPSPHCNATGIRSKEIPASAGTTPRKPSAILGTA